jgi:hypothetical protein
MPVLKQKITETILSVIESSIQSNHQQSYGDTFVYLSFWVAGKSLGLAGNGLLFDLGVSFIAIGLEPEFKSTSSLFRCPY